MDTARLHRRNPFRRDETGLSLALQGGGAHGAFTWGVLDHLLTDASRPLTAFTGTSAGAVNATAAAIGLAEGGPERARELLDSVWTAVGESGPSRWLITGSADAPALTATARAGLQLARSMSPSQLNPFELDPLRDVLEQQLDVERLRAPSAPRLTVAATNALTGRLRLFGNAEITVDTVLASACLPSMHKPVEIDSEPYWDGGYSANPPLLPLLDAPAQDALLVLICPTRHEATPRSIQQIRAREAEFAFTASFLRETELIARATERSRQPGLLGRGGLEKRLTRMRWHLIDAGPVLARLPSETRMIAHGPFLRSLFAQGTVSAETWQQAGGRLVGHRSSADLATLTSI